jgi:hypothetical protein
VVIVGIAEAPLPEFFAQISIQQPDPMRWKST